MKNYIYHTLIILISSSIMFAQTAEEAASLLQNTNGFGARSMSMGTAYTGIADDYSAIYYNPAGLAQIKRMEIFTEISHLNYGSDATFYSNTTASDENFTKFNSIGIVFPVPTYRGSLVLALGYQRIKDFNQILRFSGFNSESNGLNFIFDSDTLFFDRNVNQEERINNDGNINNWSFAGAIDVSPTTSIGIVFNFLSGTSTYAFNFLQVDTEDIYPQYVDDNFYSFSENQKIVSEYSSLQLKLGALFRPNDRLRLGINIALPSIINVEEKYTSSDNIIFDDDSDDPVDYGTSEYEYDVSTPFQFNAGASYLLKNFLLSGSIEYIDFSQIKFDDAELNSEFDYENSRIRDEFGDQLKLKIGAEYSLPSQGLKFRGGYLHVPSPIKGAPKEFNRNYYTAGLGIILDDQFVLDIAYIKGFWKDESSDDLTPGIVKEKVTYTKLFFTASFRL